MRKYRAIKAEEGVRFGYRPSSFSRNTGADSSRYTTPSFSSGMFTDPLAGTKSYLKGASSGSEEEGSSASTGNVEGGAAELGLQKGSTERPELLFRQGSDRVRDRMSRRKYRATKRGEVYDPEQELTMKGKRDQRKADRLQKRLDKTTDAMMESGQEAAQLQGARLDQNQLRREASDAEYAYDKDRYDKARAAQGPGPMGMGDSKDPSNLVPTGPSGSSLTAPTRRQVTDDEASKEELSAFNRTEKLDKRREKLLKKQGKLDTPETAQGKYERKLREEDAKELMRKEQGRYGWPYTEDMNLLPEHQEALKQQRSGQNITSRSFGHYDLDAAKNAELKAKLYPTGSSSVTPIMTTQTTTGEGDTAYERVTGKKNPFARSGENGLKIKRGYRAIR